MQRNLAPKHNVNVIIPRAAAVPSNFGMLSAVASLSFCPVRSAASRAREDHIIALVETTIADADFIAPRGNRPLV